MEKNKSRIQWTTGKRRRTSLTIWGVSNDETERLLSLLPHIWEAADSAGRKQIEAICDGSEQIATAVIEEEMEERFRRMLQGKGAYYYVRDDGYVHLLTGARVLREFSKALQEEAAGNKSSRAREQLEEFKKSREKEQRNRRERKEREKQLLMEQAANDRYAEDADMLLLPPDMADSIAKQVMERVMMENERNFEKLRREMREDMRGKDDEK